MRKFGAILVMMMAAVLATPAAEAAKSASKIIPAAVVSKQKPKASATVKKTCHSFVECLAGKQTSRTARVTGKKGKSVPDRATVEVVSWKDAGKYAAGSIIVKTSEHALYFVLDGGKARRYAIAVGRDGFRWSGTSKIVAKTEWPTWRPPAVMIEREAAKGHILPVEMKGGPGNPLGARAMYIGGTMYRIHGTNNPASIGTNASSGCIRMMNTDVIDLYELVKVGARVYVL
jgi:lipoprotein-anchoring transpeptidase ErfK/SrfK